MPEAQAWAQIACMVIVLTVALVVVVIVRGGGADEAQEPEAPLRNAVPGDGEAGLPLPG